MEYQQIAENVWLGQQDWWIGYHTGIFWGKKVKMLIFRAA
jgi:hypothetical protein